MFEQTEIVARSDVYNFDFLMSNLINYITFTARPSDYEIFDWYSMWGYDLDAKTLRIHPFTTEWMVKGSVFLFRQTNGDSAGFLLCLFVSNESENSGSPGHFVGVFNNPARQSPYRLFNEDFDPWFSDGTGRVLCQRCNLSRTQWN